MKAMKKIMKIVTLEGKRHHSILLLRGRVNFLTLMVQVRGLDHIGLRTQKSIKLGFQLQILKEVYSNSRGLNRIQAVVKRA